MDTYYLTLEQILVIHQDQVNRFGGLTGLKSLELLESTVYRPQSTFGGKELYPTLFDKAAALVHSLLLNHPFVEGNKRTAIVAMVIFLHINGIHILAKNDEIVTLALEIENRKMNIEKISKWLKTHS
ncbi:type II toxin-antitoxin system death-on-curing family toxin [Candidatus Gottesmanbacteria bacterium]|nr:type II toxin-antitoxin system death-on-curing family toxin [Candidatus Gottesmanbacteria bacterium]